MSHPHIFFVRCNSPLLRLDSLNELRFVQLQRKSDPHQLALLLKDVFVNDVFNAHSLVCALLETAGDQLFELLAHVQRDGSKLLFEHFDFQFVHIRRVPRVLVHA